MLVLASHSNPDLQGLRVHIHEKGNTLGILCDWMSENLVPDCQDWQSITAHMDRQYICMLK